MYNSTQRREEMAMIISENTVRSRYGKWVKNLVRNEDNIRKGIKIAEFPNRLKSKPVLIIGGGPSLDKNIELIKHVKGRAFIICTDTVFRKLNKFVIPDAVIALDSDDFLKDYMDYENSENVPLFSEVTVSPEALKDWKGKIVWFASAIGSNDKLSPILERDFNDGKPIGRVMSGGCVVNSAIFIAKHILRADPIILVGADCGFYDIEKHHCDGLNDLEENNRIEMDEDIYGENIFTTSVYQMYALWAENFVTMRDSATKKPQYEGMYINATEGGTIKKGWLQMRLEHVIFNYLPNKYNFNDFMDLDKPIVEKNDPVKKMVKKTTFSPKQIKEVTEIEAN